MLLTSVLKKKYFGNFVPEFHKKILEFIFNKFNSKGNANSKINFTLLCNSAITYYLHNV